MSELCHQSPDGFGTSLQEGTRYILEASADNRFSRTCRRLLGLDDDRGVLCLRAIRMSWRGCPVSTRLAARNLFLVTCMFRSSQSHLRTYLCVPPYTGLALLFWVACVLLSPTSDEYSEKPQPLPNVRKDPSSQSPASSWFNLLPSPTRGGAGSGVSSYIQRLCWGMVRSIHDCTSMR